MRGKSHSRPPQGYLKGVAMLVERAAKPFPAFLKTEPDTHLPASTNYKGTQPLDNTTNTKTYGGRHEKFRYIDFYISCVTEALQSLDSPSDLPSRCNKFSQPVQLIEDSPCCKSRRHELICRRWLGRGRLPKFNNWFVWLCHAPCWQLSFGNRMSG